MHFTCTLTVFRHSSKLKEVRVPSASLPCSSVTWLSALPPICPSQGGDSSPASSREGFLRLKPSCVPGPVAACPTRCRVWSWWGDFCAVPESQLCPHPSSVHDCYPSVHLPLHVASWSGSRPESTSRQYHRTCLWVTSLFPVPDSAQI